MGTKTQRCGTAWQAQHSRECREGPLAGASMATPRGLGGRNRSDPMAGVGGGSGRDGLAPGTYRAAPLSQAPNGAGPRALNRVDMRFHADHRPWTEGGTRVERGGRLQRPQPGWCTSQACSARGGGAAGGTLKPRWESQ